MLESRLSEKGNEVQSEGEVMPRTEIKETTGPRYIVSLPVRAEWSEKKTGKQVITEGTTHNVGPHGAMVSLQQLPAVGSRITITIQGPDGPEVKARAEVVRLVRDIQQPLASLDVLEEKEKWRGKVWEPAGVFVSQTNDEEEVD